MKQTSLSILAFFVLGLIFTSCDNKSKSSEEVKETVVLPTEVVTAEAIDSNAVAQFTFAEESFDFGTIQQGDSVMHTFTFENTGSVPLVISQARGSCGCTVPKYPTQPIPVGGKGDILVKFNSRGKKGAQNKTVTLSANTEPANTILTITSFVQTPDSK